MLKKIIIIAIVFILGSQSIYFKRLSDLNKEENSFKVDSETIEKIYREGIIESELIIPVDQLINDVNLNTELTFKDFGNRMGIGESAYFLVTETSNITKIEDGQITLESGTVVDAKYIFGNELRDASRFLSLEDFSSQSDLNALTEAFNKYVRNQVVNLDLKVGESISYIGACRIDKRELPIRSVVVIPAKIVIQ